MNNQDSNKSYRILVIDDNRAIHEDFRKILCSASAEATAWSVTANPRIPAKSPKRSKEEISWADFKPTNWRVREVA